MIQVLLDEERFALQHGDETGTAVEYGEVASVESRGRRYIGICDDPDGDPETFELTAKPRSIIAVPFQAEDVEMEVEDDDEEEEEADESEDDEA